jgi:hypothetical protein
VYQFTGWVSQCPAPVSDPLRHLTDGGGGDQQIKVWADNNGEVDPCQAGKWMVPLCLAGALALGGCGSSTASPKTASPHLGVLAGTAGECSGLPGRPAHPVQVIVYRGSHVVVKQTKLGSHPFRFSLPPGKYRVTTDQSYVIPVNVVLHSGLVAHAAVLSTSCD